MAFVDIEPRFQRHLQRQGLCSFKDFFFYAGGEVVGAHSSRNVVRMELGGFRAFLKREYRVAWKDYWASWSAGFGLVSKSRREWQILHALRTRGIACPQPIAVGEDRGQAFLLVREIAGSVDLSSYLHQMHGATAEQRTRLARLLARTLAHFHGAGFTHPDLYAKHVFIDLWNQAIRFIDFQRTRSRRWVNWRQRWRDLAALDASLSGELASPRDRLIFLSTYLKATRAVRPRRLLRRSLWAIARRTHHLLARRKVRQMRRPLIPARRVESFRVTVYMNEDDRAPHEPADPSFPSRGRHG